VTLRCSIPVDFSFSLDVIQPHPYFLIRPLHGVVPASGSVDIHISFHPITLGTCTSVIRLFIAEHNFQPIETVINARAVSGMIEQKALQQAEERISNLLSNKTLEVSQRFGETTFGTATTPPAGLSLSLAKNKEISPRTSKLKSTLRSQDSTTTTDPVAAVLKKTFAADGVGPTLQSALLKPSEDGTLLLGSKVPALIESGPLQGVNRVVGALKATQPVHPRGVGSGNVFDSAAEFMSSQAKLSVSQKTRGKGKTEEAEQESEKIMEGLRIPQNLSSVAAVNFVLTQEPGKLKPKDLKVAIERNREERRRQEIEQTKIREQGGGGAGGGLDLRAILADEKLNSEPGDAFKRQLREMAFLSDMEDTKKEEIEKTFRVSEEFIGASILSAEDLEVIKAQRKAYGRHRSRSDWRAHLSRMETAHHSAQSEVRAAPPIPPTQFPQSLLSGDSASDLILRCSPPSFDSNKNDVWGKRMGTLRRFISIVGQWIVQRRVERRLALLRQRLQGAGVVDRQSAKAFVEADSSSPGSASASATKSSQAAGASSRPSIAPSAHSLASLVCSLPNQALQKMRRREKLLQQQDAAFLPTAEMCRRVLFPKHIVDEVAVRKPMTSAPVDDLLSFDDRTFAPLKPRPEFIDLGYERETVSLCPVFFPPLAKLNLKPRAGAPEESALRSSAGALFSAPDMLALAAMGCDRVFAQATFLPPPLPLEEDSAPLALLLERERGEALGPPAWLLSLSEQETAAGPLDPSSTERDLSLPRPALRIFNPPLLSAKETEPDWALRSIPQQLQFDADPTLRSSLLSVPGFRSVQTYLLGDHNCRLEDCASPPAPGPTITDFFLPDSDLHGSGLCCSALDHRGALGAFEEPMGGGPLQQRLAREDYLTDSESDDEEEYQAHKPTFSGVRDLLRPAPASQTNASEEIAAEPAKGKKPTTKPAPAAPLPPAPQTPLQECGSLDGFSVLDEADRKSDQVELMRDRKTLEHATHLRQLRETKASLLSDRSLLSSPPSLSSSLIPSVGCRASRRPPLASSRASPCSSRYTSTPRSC
jgi:hypothetical protein